MQRSSPIALLIFPEAIKDSISLSLNVKLPEVVWFNEFIEGPGFKMCFANVFFEYHKSPFKIAAIPLLITSGGSSLKKSLEWYYSWRFFQFSF